MKIYLHRRADYGMVNAEGKINFDEIFASLFVINVSILMYKKPPEIQYNTEDFFLYYFENVSLGNCNI